MPPKQRNIRKKRTLEEEEAADGDAVPEVEKETLEDLKLLQKQRKRTVGIHSSALAASRAGEADLGEQDNDLMEAYVKEQTGQAILTEEQHMERFVELEVAKRLGKQVDDLTGAPSARERAELELYDVPEALKVRMRGACALQPPSSHLTAMRSDARAACTMSRDGCRGRRPTDRFRCFSMLRTPLHPPTPTTPPPPQSQAQLKSEVSIPGLNAALTEVEVSKEARLRKIEETEAMKRKLLERDAGWCAHWWLAGTASSR